MRFFSVCFIEATSCNLFGYFHKLQLLILERQSDSMDGCVLIAKYKTLENTKYVLISNFCKGKFKTKNDL